jgi:hypothetical protein
MAIKIILNGQELDFDAVVALMDDDIREKLHDDFERRTGDADRIEREEAQVFVDEYAARHEAVFGAPFVVG